MYFPDCRILKLRYTLEGDFESETSGLIISITNSNPLSGAVEGVAKMGGSAAEKWVAKQVVDGAFKKKRFTS